MQQDKTALHQNADKTSGLFQAVHEQSGNEIADLFAGADVGLALFDANLHLLACNELYRTLCGYLSNDLKSGVEMQQLMATTFRRLNVPADEIPGKVARIIERLMPGTAYSFRYTAPSGSIVEIRRRRLPNGTVVETARQIDAPASDMDINTQYEMIAEQSRSRLMHALDVMADGFALYDANDRIVSITASTWTTAPSPPTSSCRAWPRRKSSASPPCAAPSC